MLPRGSLISMCSPGDPNISYPELIADYTRVDPVIGSLFSQWFCSVSVSKQFPSSLSLCSVLSHGNISYSQLMWFWRVLFDLSYYCYILKETTSVSSYSQYLWYWCQFLLLLSRKNANWRSPRAAVIPNFHLPMRSSEVKNRYTVMAY